ncbi:MAG: hypothetical protein NT049_04120, partial [Planctomycetota bacterium]|nr:hypothetical protein [Planctomycetota bacterium]
MADLLQQGAAWLEGMRHKHDSRPVTYRRGEQDIALNATVGRSMFQVVTADGVVEQVERRDYLIRACDLVLGGAVVLPQVGDRIRETVGDKVQVYEVMGAGQEKHFRPSDSDGL